jgi:thiol-disulfide isomerase/thioredoxin
MKTTALILIFILTAFCGIAQTCVLSGTTKDTSIKELQLALLYADGYDKTSAIQIKVSPDGSFKQLIETPHPVFAMLTANNLRQRLLLSAGRDLHVRIGAGTKKTLVFSGKAAAENELVHHSILDSTPFFMKGVWQAEKGQYEETIPYTKITVNGWRDTIMNQVEKEIANTTTSIQKSATPPTLKKILVSETGYAYQCYLNEFTRNNLGWSKNPNRDSLLTCVMQWKPLPDSLTLISGHYANMMLERYSKYAFLMIVKKKEGGKEGMKARISAYMGIPYDTIESQVKTYGEVFVLSWLYARQHLPANIQDKMLFNKLIEAADGGYVSTVRFLLQHIHQNYPSSNYRVRAEAVMQRMEQAVKSNAGNAHIIYKNATDIRSLSDLAKPYAGKIVYLDIWGTWCGPCKEEMHYVHELKQKYAGKDIVFVYLDMDDPLKESVWKEYVQLTGLEGDHYRMDEHEIGPIWKAVEAAGGQINIYPTFVLIDRQGNIVHPNAERPSSRQKLYAQLDKLL